MILASSQLFSHATDGDNFTKSGYFSSHGYAWDHRLLYSYRNKSCEERDTGRRAILRDSSHWNMQMIAILVEVFCQILLGKEVKDCNFDNFY